MSFSNSNCVETTKSGDKFYILKAPEYSQGPVDIIPEEEYAERLKKALETDDPTVMFSGLEVTEQFSQGEIYAYGLYLKAGHLAMLNEGEIVTAYENPEQHIPDLATRAAAGNLQ